MIDFLKSMNRLGKDFQFNLEGGSYQIHAGGIFTIIINVVLIWYFGKDIYLRRDPNFIKENHVLHEYPSVHLNNKNVSDPLNRIFFAMALRKHKSSESILDPRIIEYYLKLHGAYMNLEGHITKTKSFIYEKKCSSNHIDANTIHKHKLNEFICFDLKYFTLGGHVTHKNFTYLSYEASWCNSGTEERYNIKCMNPKNFPKVFEKLYLVYFYQQNLIRPKEFEFLYEATYPSKFLILMWIHGG